MTTPILFREYIWLVNTIYKAGKISLSEINDKWIETDVSSWVDAGICGTNQTFAD